ncbi:unnamed protein product [Mucor hiemalis]
MTSYQELNHFANTDLTYCQKEKQRIDFILDDVKGSDEVIFHNSKLPELKAYSSTVHKKLSFNTYEQSLPTNTANIHNNNNLINRLPSPFDSNEEEANTNTQSMPPTEREMQYIKRIHALMTLVSKQTKEIQSLREVIATFNDDPDNQHMFNENRKRNKQF